MRRTVFDCVVMSNVDFFQNEKCWHEIIKRYHMYRIWSKFTSPYVWLYAPAYNFMSRFYRHIHKQNGPSVFCDVNRRYWLTFMFSSCQEKRQKIFNFTYGWANFSQKEDMFHTAATRSLREHWQRCGGGFVHQITFPYFSRCSLYKLQSDSYIRANKNNLSRGELAGLLVILSLSQSTHGSHNLHYCRQRHKFSESANKSHLNFLQSTLVVVCRTFLKIRMTEYK